MNFRDYRDRSDLILRVNAARSRIATEIFRDYYIPEVLRRYAVTARCPLGFDWELVANFGAASPFHAEDSFWGAMDVVHSVGPERRCADDPYFV